MKHTILLLCLLCATAAAYAEPSRPGFYIDHHEPATNFRTVGAEAGGRYETLAFEGLGHTWRLVLAPNPRVSGAPGSDVEALAGRVEGADDSWVRLTRQGERYWGLIRHRGEWLAIEPGRDVAAFTGRGTADPQGSAIYRLADTRIDPGAMSCGNAGAMRRLMTGDQAMTALEAELDRTLQATTGTTLANLTFSVVADAPFGDSFGGDSEAAVVNRINAVDGIYREQLGVQIELTGIVLLDDDTDPFTAASNGAIEAEDLLNEFGDFRSSSGLADDALSHLLTRRQLENGTVGIAFFSPRSTLCSPRGGAALTRASQSMLLDVAVIAHEVGHNFGAEHDNEEDSVCEDTPSGFIMAPSISASVDEFSACSVNTVQPNIERELTDDRCLTAVSSVAFVIELPASDLEVAVDDTFTIAARVINVGTETIAGARLRTTVPPALVARSADLGGAACTVDGPLIECLLGSLEPDAVVEIEHELAATATGTHEIVFVVDDTETPDQPGSEASATVTVSQAMGSGSGGDDTSPTPAASSGGGGGAGTALLMLLLLGVALRFRYPVATS